MADAPDKAMQFLFIRQLCAEVKYLDGDAAEIGVYQGASAEVICEALPEATVYLFDSFAGMPAAMCTAGLDMHVAGDFGDTSLSKVQSRLERFDNAYFVPGNIPESFNGKDIRLSFTHIDCDLYKSTKAAIEWAWENTIPGGVILDDDYLCSSCAGAKKAIDEFLADHPRTSVVFHNRLAIIRRK